MITKKIEQRALYVPCFLRQKSKLLRKQIHLVAIAKMMSEDGYDHGFIDNGTWCALRYDGYYDLMCLWRDETDPAERNLIILDLIDLAREIVLQFYNGVEIEF